MSWISAIPIIGKLIDGAADIIKEVVTDKDKQNAIISKLEQVKQTVYMTELQTKTIPWVDALHKMGRQIMNVLTIGAVVCFAMFDVTITNEMVILLGGPNIAYQLVKGKGKG